MKMLKMAILLIAGIGCFYSAQAQGLPDLVLHSDDDCPVQFDVNWVYQCGGPVIATSSHSVFNAILNVNSPTNQDLVVSTVDVTTLGQTTVTVNVCNQSGCMPTNICQGVGFLHWSDNATQGVSVEKFVSCP